jgi:acyl-CoA hydrolase
MKLEIEKGDEFILAAHGFWVMVAVDANGKPQPITPLVAENDEQKRFYAKAQQMISVLRQFQ